MDSTEHAHLLDRRNRLTVHRVLIVSALGGLALLLAGPFALAIAGVRIPRGLGFRLVMLWLVACSALWWAWADRWGARTLGRRGRWIRVLVGVAAAALVGPAVHMLIMGRMFSLVAWPIWTTAVVQVWHMLLGLGVPVAVVLSLVLSCAKLLTRRQAAPPQMPAVPDRGLTRRDLLAGAVVHLPLAVVAGTAVISSRRLGRFVVNCYDLPAPWLPPRLRGLTITHVSDLHVGRLYRPAFLPRLVDEVNRLDSDIVAWTGDLVDVSNDMLPPVLAALRQIRPRHGAFLCIGNHDLIDDGDIFARAVRSDGHALLVDERRRLEIDGECISIVGLGWSRSEHGAALRPGHAEHARAALAGFDPRRDGPCIALAHHPHAFDVLAPAGASLTLSGHTHGGQIMWAPPAADGRARAERDRGLGALLFRYLRGFYERDGATLFVNSGVGNWFPLRLNAPAEVVRIRLV